MQGTGANRDFGQEASSTGFYLRDQTTHDIQIERTLNDSKRTVTDSNPTTETQVHKMLQSESNSRHITLKINSLETSCIASITIRLNPVPGPDANLTVPAVNLRPSEIWYGPDTSLESSPTELRGRRLPRSIDQKFAKSTCCENVNSDEACARQRKLATAGVTDRSLKDEGSPNGSAHSRLHQES